MKIRDAISADKSSVLEFCSNTFSWGDYIKDVWDFWIKEGNLFVVEEKQSIGICHAFFTYKQVWIEGIRIASPFRRLGLASKLIKYVESFSIKKNILNSFMLIDTQNVSSLSMAKKLDYKILETWHFYSLTPKKNNNYIIKFNPDTSKIPFNHYVKSWRWLPLNDNLLRHLSEEKKIIYSDIDGNFSFAILSDSEHFDQTLIVTLHSSSTNTTHNLILYLQNFCAEKNYQRIQILTKDTLSDLHDLEHKISFHLMQKFLV